MRDWEALVEQQLRGLALDSAENGEVVAELAEHLREHWEELRRQGIPEEEAARQTLSQIGDWKTLRWKIEKAKKKENVMTNRVKQFWLPSLVTMFLSMGLLALIQTFGPKPWMISRHEDSAWSLIAPAAIIYLSWVLLLPLVGALGAWISLRSGGSRRAAFSSVVFPVLPFLVSLVLGIPMIAMFNEHVTQNVAFRAMFVGLFALVLAPGAALLAGGLLARTFLLRQAGSSRVLNG
jgi:hypothetical protein